MPVRGYSRRVWLKMKLKLIIDIYAAHSFSQMRAHDAVIAIHATIFILDVVIGPTVSKNSVGNG